MQISDINPLVRYARISRSFLPRPYYSICYDCRIFFILNGSGYVQTEPEEYNFSKGTVLFFPFGTKYRFHFSSPAEESDIIAIDFDMTHEFAEKSDSLGTASETNFLPRNLSVTELLPEFSTPIVKNAPQLESLLLQCTSEFLNEQFLYREICSTAVKQSLLFLLREQSYDYTSPLIQELIAYIDRNYADPTLQNSTIAEKFGYHPYYLSNRMKQATGYSLHAYLVRHRIQSAKNYLLTTDWDISTIAWKCGFNSVPFFIKTFREQTGCTPKKYRSEMVYTAP